MAFFDNMLSESVNAHGQLSRLPQRAETVALRNSIDNNHAHLHCIHKFIHSEHSDAESVSAVLPGELLVSVAQLFNSLESTLSLLSDSPKGFPQRGELSASHLGWLQSSAEKVGIENQKLRSLLYTLNSPSIATPRTDITRDDLIQREKLTDDYINLEIRRLQVNSPVVDSHSLRLSTWNKVNWPSYHKYISEKAISRLERSSLGEILHDVASHIYMARLSTCDEADRWVRLLLCSWYLQHARSSAEYRTLSRMCDEPSNSIVFDLGFTVQNFVTELEIDMLDVLSSHRSSIQTSEVVSARSAVLALYPTGNSGTSGGEPEESSSATNSNPQAGERFWTFKLHERDNGLSLTIKMGLDGALLLELDEWPHHLVHLQDRDLRQMTVHPQYPTPDYPFHRCDLTYNYAHRKKTIEGVARLCFRNARDLKRFQYYATGFKVVGDFNDGIMIRVHKKWRLRGREKTYIGKLQIWDKKREKAPEEVARKVNPALPRAQTGLSSMSRASTTSNLTLKTRDMLAARLERTEDDSYSLVMEAPVAPLVVLLVQKSPDDRNVEPGDLLAFSVPQKAAIDTSMCHCLDAANECTRCFISSVERVGLKAGRMEYPTSPKQVDWIEATFANDIDRLEFAQTMGEQMTIHAGRRRVSVQGHKLVVENHTNTADFEKDNS
ncbi:hypothetical protein B0O99DRAFT_646483 [Bisporella sp. PMI_857]|nr:hypothetical protein B0O99DRAFT_646483 [Bisporella sp. PMI_857]